MAAAVIGSDSGGRCFASGLPMGIEIGCLSGSTVDCDDYPMPNVVTRGCPPLTYWDKHSALKIWLPTLQLRSAVWSGADPRMWAGRDGMAQLFA